MSWQSNAEESFDERSNTIEFKWMLNVVTPVNLKH